MGLNVGLMLEWSVEDETWNSWMIREKKYLLKGPIFGGRRTTTLGVWRRGWDIVDSLCMSRLIVGLLWTQKIVVVLGKA